MKLELGLVLTVDAQHQFSMVSFFKRNYTTSSPVNLSYLRFIDNLGNFIDNHREIIQVIYKMSNMNQLRNW